LSTQLRKPNHLVILPTDAAPQFLLKFTLACVAWRLLSGETAITNPRVARSLGERQLRNRFLAASPLVFAASPLHSRSKNSLNRQATQAKFTPSFKVTCYFGSTPLSCPCQNVISAFHLTYRRQFQNFFAYHLSKSYYRRMLLPKQFYVTSRHNFYSHATPLQTFVGLFLSSSNKPLTQVFVRQH